VSGSEPAIDADPVVSKPAPSLVEGSNHAHGGMIAVMRICDLLRKGGLEAIEAEILLAHILHRDRSWLTMHDEDELPPERVQLYQSLRDRRRRGEPIAYLTGVCEFYGRTFVVDNRVLIPRPSTEGLVDLALDVLANGREEKRSVDSGIVAFSRIHRHALDTRKVVDIGTGSGCIAFTLLLEHHDLTAIATDIDQAALDVAAVNAQRYGVRDRIEFRRGEDLSCVADVTEPFIIVSNPPYIPTGTRLPTEMSFEPQHALCGGEDGTDVLRQIVNGAAEHPFCRGLVLECQEDQAEKLVLTAESCTL